MSVKALKDIREELKELRLLHKQLVDKRVSPEKSTKEEKDESIDEKELMNAL